MWLWIITGLSFILGVHGFASGGFPQSCGSLLPQHESAQPQGTEAPFEISFEKGSDGASFVVSLRSTDSGTFSGFMLEVREKGRLPIGKFSQHGSNPTTLLNCEGLVASAVSQGNNQPRTSFEVNWTPPETGLNRNIDFRATFVRSFSRFWINVTTPLSPVLTTTATVPSTTRPITISSTTEPKTTSGATQPNTIPSSSMITTVQPSIKPPQPSVHGKKQATVLMVVDSALLVMKMELSNIITNAITNRCTSCLLDRILKLSCLVLSGAMEISALGLKIASSTPHTTLIALVCVVIILTIFEIAIVSLPLGPSHELKQICDLGVKACSVVHKAFTIAFIYTGYFEIADKNRRGFWPLWVLIAYTAWILLFVVWIFVVTTQKHIILRRRKKVSSMSAAHRDGRKKMWLPTAVPVIPVIFIVGTTAFAAALIVGILQLPEE